VPCGQSDDLWKSPLVSVEIDVQRDDVGRTPRSADDALVGLCLYGGQPDPGSGVDGASGADGASAPLLLVNIFDVQHYERIPTRYEFLFRTCPEAR
jgi:hypothetical protein